MPLTRELETCEWLTAEVAHSQINFRAFHKGLYRIREFVTVDPEFRAEFCLWRKEMQDDDMESHG